MKKTEERKYLDDKILEWANKHKKILWLICSIVYIISVIAFTILIVDVNGGPEEFWHSLNYYPEQEYQQLEQEMHNIIVEGDGIYPERLSNGDIKHDITYRETESSEGEYKIILKSDNVTVTGTIKEDLKKEYLIIERKHETENEYKKEQYVPTVMGILILPMLVMAFLWAVSHILIFILYIAEVLYVKLKKKK